MEEYFQGDPTLRKVVGNNTPDSIYRLNRFLADDRILAFELVLESGSKWTTDIAEKAIAYTDVPSNTTDFINQRRRWLNGAFAATLYSLRLPLRLRESKHNVVRLVLLVIQLVHNIAAFVLAWFSLSGFLLTTFIINEVSGEPPDDAPVEGFPFGRATPVVNAVIQTIYICTIVFQFVLALGGRPRHAAVSYIVSFAIFGIVQLYMIMNLVYLTKRLVDFKFDTNGGSRYAFINEYYSDVGYVTIFVTAIAIFGVYIAAGILSFDPFHLVNSWAQYMFVSSSYINILNIYAFSNIHDVSWGQKSGKKTIQRAPTLDVKVHQVAGGPPQATVPVLSVTMEDLDFRFEETAKRALSPHQQEKEAEPDDMQGKFMQFRTTLVAVYIFSNFLVCWTVLDQTWAGFHMFGDPYWRRIYFFRIWMWANSSLFLLKGAGMIWYRIRSFWRMCFYRR